VATGPEPNPLLIIQWFCGGDGGTSASRANCLMFWPTIRYVALTNLTNRWSYFLARRRARDSYAGGATQRRWQLAETKPQPQPERAAPAKSCGQIERLAQSATHSRS